MEDQLLPAQRGGAKALLLTVLGEFVLPSGGSAWTSTLVTTAETLGIGEKNARQALARIADQGLIESRPGDRDRRQRLLRLTPAGMALEQGLFTVLHDNMVRAYSSSGGQAVAGYWVVMQHLMGVDAQAIFARIQRV